MIPSLLIALRETLEAVLIIGLVLGYLNKTKQTKYKKIVWLALALAVVASLAGAFLFQVLAGGFEGQAEQIFEGVTMILGAFLLTTMIFFVLRHKHLDLELENQLSQEITKQDKWGLFFLVFISILREGIELALFLGTASLVSADNNLIGALAGILLAIFLGYALMAGLMKFNAQKFINITGFILILFAAGLVAHGIHEFEEAGLIPIVIEHVWDINPSVGLDGSYPAWHENGWLGGIFKGLLGYNGNPSLLEVIGYLSYLVIIIGLWRKSSKIRN